MFTLTAAPVAGEEVTVAKLMLVTLFAVFTVHAVHAVAAAFAGTTDKSPNPSEATATADTFFNEIVFTIFLSFSQIKDDLLSGW
jgi:Na+/phosphate symporter